ncbi:hypothetical protein Lser_V15G03813 [Lactuca serriola]
MGSDIIVRCHVEAPSRQRATQEARDLNHNMVNQLCDTWFGYHKFFASIPRFSRKNTSSQVPSKLEKQEVHVNSYASEVRGVPRENHSEVSFVEIQSRDFLVEKGKLACLSRAMDFHTLPNLRKICLDEELEDLEIPYLGGLSVMVEFKSKHVWKNFLANESLTNCIKEKTKPWDRNSITPPNQGWRKRLGVEDFMYSITTSIIMLKVNTTIINIIEKVTP